MSNPQASSVDDQGHDFLEEIVTAVSADRARELAAKIEQLILRVIHAREHPHQPVLIQELRGAAQDVRAASGAFIGSPTQVAARAAERLGTRLLLGTRVSLAEWNRVQQQLEALRRIG